MTTTKAKNTIRKNTNLWAYLEEKGVLENGTDEQIKQAKREYKKIYMFNYKRRQRETNPEYIISFSTQKGEHKKVAEASKEHKTSVTKFIKAATLAYLNKTYIVPDKEQVATLEQTLSHCRNEIQRISRNRIQPVQEKIQAIEKRITEMEESINQLLRHPPESPVTNHDCKNQTI